MVHSGYQDFYLLCSFWFHRHPRNLCSSVSEKQGLRLFLLQQQKGLGSCSAHSQTASGLCVPLMLFLLLLGLYGGKEIEHALSIPLISSSAATVNWDQHSAFTQLTKAVCNGCFCVVLQLAVTVLTLAVSQQQGCCICSWHAHLDLSLIMAVKYRCLVLFLFLLS